MTYRLADGNTVDDPTHVPTWDGLVGLLGRTDFLHVADSKLCSRKAMGHIDRNHGRFVTVMPRSRTEDGAFRQHLQTRAPVWTRAARRPGKRLGDPDEIYSTTPAPLPSAEGYRIVWVHSTAKASRDAHSRSGRIDPGVTAIEALDAKLAGPRSRYKTRVAVEQAAAEALADSGADRWVSITVSETTSKWASPRIVENSSMMDGPLAPGQASARSGGGFVGEFFDGDHLFAAGAVAAWAEAPAGL